MSRVINYHMSFKDKLRKAAILNPLKEDEAALVKERLAICKGCPELRKPLDQCAACGCFVKAKTMLKAASCPLGKW